MIKKVVLYIRVSTEEQAREGYSIQAQIDRLTEFAKSQGWEIVEIYIDDGQSAKNLNRPEMQRMIKDIKNRKFGIVLVYKLDRMVRSVLDLHELLQLFDKYDVKFRSATEMFDTTSAMGRFFITLVGAMAQWEREQLSERVIYGMEQAAREGNRNGTNIPFGYVEKDGKIELDPDDVKIVKLIFDLYVNNNKGARGVAIELNRRKIKDKLWSPQHIRYILTNESYLGKFCMTFKENKKTVTIDDAQPPIIENELFEKARGLMKARSTGGKKYTSTYIFSGVMKCGRCGGSFVSAGSTKWKSYRCINRLHYGKEGCDMPLCSEKTIMKKFSELLSWDLSNEIKKMIHSLEAPENSNEQLNQLEKELEEVSAELDRLLKLYLKKKVTEERYEREEKLLSEREEYLKEQIDKLNPLSQLSVMDIEEFANQLQGFKQQWEQLTEEEQKNYINRYFESITVHTDPIDYPGKKGKKTEIQISDVKFRLAQE